MTRVLVFVKMVPDVTQLKFDPEKKTLIREGVRNEMNPFDKKAVEAGLQVKDKLGGTVAVLTMGPPQAEDILREALSLGVDEAYLISDRAFAGSDTLATSTALSFAARKAGFDLILGGKSSVDAETSQLLPQIAEHVGAALVTNANKIEHLHDNWFRVERETEQGYEELEVGLPAVISVTEKINKPRFPTAENKAKSKTSPVAKWSAKDLSENLALFGSAGSPTIVQSIYDASYQRTPSVYDLAKSPNAIEDALNRVEELLKAKPSSRPIINALSKDAKCVWIIFIDGRVETKTALEVLSKTRSMGLGAVAVFVNGLSDDLLKEAGESGASSAIRLQNKREIGGWSSHVLAQAIARAIQSEKPYAVLFPSTTRGRETGGRVATALRAGLTGDAVDLRISENGELIQIKPSFGGNIMAEIISRTEPQMATVRPGVFERLRFESGPPKLKDLDIQLDAQESVKLVSTRKTVDDSMGDLDSARVVVCAGYGVGSREGFEEVAAFASKMGIAVAATRRIVDLGWAPPQVQVGLTGKSIRPDLYIALGVSGATNHVVGVRSAKVVLAVNTHSPALIFKACDVGIIADYKQAFKLMESRLRKITKEIQRA